MRVQLRRDLFPAPVPVVRISLSADHMAEALILSAIATGEIAILQQSPLAVVTGLTTLRARWVAFAALIALHPNVAFSALGDPLGCGLNPLRALAICRRATWWREADVQAVFIALAEAWDPRVIADGRDLRRSLSGLLADPNHPFDTPGGT